MASSSEGQSASVTQAALYEILVDRAESWGIPKEDIPALTRNIELVDWEWLLLDTAETAEVIGVHRRHISNLVRDENEWMAPLIERYSATGKVNCRLWLRSNVIEYARHRARREGVVRRIRRSLERIRH